MARSELRDEIAASGVPHEPAEFSLVLGGPLYLLFLRTSLARHALEPHWWRVIAFMLICCFPPCCFSLGQSPGGRRLRPFPVRCGDPHSMLGHASAIDRIGMDRPRSVAEQSEIQRVRSFGHAPPEFNSRRDCHTVLRHHRRLLALEPIRDDGPIEMVQFQSWRGDARWQPWRTAARHVRSSILGRLRKSLHRRKRVNRLVILIVTPIAPEVLTMVPLEQLIERLAKILL